MAGARSALLRPPSRTAAVFTAPAGLAGRQVVLAVNAGSSSLKFGLYAAPDAPAVWSGQFEGMEPGGQPRWQAAGHSALLAAHADGPWPAALALLADALAAAGVRLAAVAHRIVHGGEAFTDPVLLDGARIAALAALAPLAPLHQPHNLAGVRAFAARWPGVAQIGCFDTAFHASLPPLERRLPLPAELVAGGVQRYGFHGLSYDHLVRRLTRSSARMGGRALLAHLGNGASLCATVAGRSVATSMGFSALDGLMMGTRCGSLDAGVVLHLWRQGWSPADVEVWVVPCDEGRVAATAAFDWLQPTDHHAPP